ncbi:hypothetical protein J2S49_000572 [Arcanobacterium wilhelmae]|uniref:Uncharacterized protein n=1 Tax=Arcanobacterium wilhelmae TaxID=1803177 RepID=A0ABT9NB87_9ACTO|nr:hypothetical protein [Arcanobacterium wilhelmae]MDP9800496.1 hypothetical protein [Arcanobacterium wilhelmae]WFN89915.1 hypothetical protein P8A24_06880 [Arcanobacterium wilhelmae]
MKRYAGIALALVGAILAITVGVRALFAQDTLSVKAVVPSSGAVVATAPGVLELVAPDAHVQLDANGEQIQWALGSATDVEAWIGTSSGSRLVGLSSWDKAKVEPIKGEKAQVDADAKLGAEKKFALSSPWWVKSGSGKDRVEFDFTAPEGGQQVLIATTTSAKAPQLTLTWDHSLIKTSPWSTIAIGVLLMLVGLFLLLQDWQERDMRERRAKRAATRVSTTPLATYDGDLTAEDRPVQRTHTDRAFGAAVVPGTSRSMALRNRPLSDEDRLVIDEVAPEPTVGLTGVARTSLYEGQNRATVAAASGHTLGAGIVPSSERAEQFRGREVPSLFPPKEDVEAPTAEAVTQEQPSDIGHSEPEDAHIDLEGTDTADAQLAPASETASEGAGERVETDAIQAEEHEGNARQGRDWRSRWSIRGKGENDA